MVWLRVIGTKLFLFQRYIVAKTRKQKESLLSALTERIARAKITVLFKYQGLRVQETEELRRAIRQVGAEMLVTKTSLTRIALRQTGIEVSGDALNKPLALLFSYDDEVKPAKELTLFAKSHQAIEILGGILEKKMIDASVIKALAALPSRPELLARMVGAMSGPLQSFVAVLSGLPRNLVTALKQIEQQKQNT